MQRRQAIFQRGQTVLNRDQVIAIVDGAHGADDR